MGIRTLFSLISISLALGGCEERAPAPRHDHAHHDHAAATSADEAKAPAGPTIETDSFLLAVAPTRPKLSAGQSGELEIALESRGEWHVNQDYPIRVDIKAAPEVKVPKPELVKDDATEFGEEKVRFTAYVEPSAPGEHEVTCDVSFAMCTDENCILETRTLAMVLEVQ